MIREHGDGDEPFEDRYQEILDNVHEDEINEIPYRGISRSAIYIYQMLLGDADPSSFFAFKQIDSGSFTFLFLWVVYVGATIAIVLVLMNIIIAIMGEVQGQRGEHGRAVVYSTQAKVAIEQYSKFKHMILLGNDE